MTNLYLATDKALVVLTLEGNSCQPELNLTGFRSQCVAVDPLQSELVYCGTLGDGVWCSVDAGRNWQPAGDGISHPKVLSIAVSRTERPDGRGVVYVGTEPSAVYRSDDGGGRWRECSDVTALPSSSEWSFPPRPEMHHARWIHPDPHTKGRLFVAIEAGAMIRSPDGGTTWEDRVPTGPIDTHELATHLSAPGRLYSAAGDGYFESTDGGDTWQRLEEGLRHNYVWSVAVAAGDPDTRVIASAASARHSHNKPGAESFIYRRTAKSEWQQVRHGLPEPRGRRTALLVAHPDDSGTFFAVWESDLFRSIDGGSTWEPLAVAWPEGFQVGEPRGLAVGI